jgi:hypothetical protein
LIGAWSKLRYWDGEKWMLDDKQCHKQDYVGRLDQAGKVER